MNAVQEMIQSGVAESIGWTLLHSLWQGAAIAAALGLVLSLTRQKAARLRYRWASAALVLMAVCAFVTFGQEWSRVSEKASAASESPFSVEETELSPVIAPLALSSRSMEKWVPWLSLVWVAGFVIFTLRWIGGLAWLQRARFRDVRVMEYAWQNQLNRLASRMGLHKTLLLIESPHISSPMVIGHLRPVILFPVGLITGLSPEQLEAIFVHELAHIRRYDFVVNLVQTWI
ncbi:MAG: M56 family metallopeptidase, partial [Bacteroidetes bacterium]